MTDPDDDETSREDAIYTAIVAFVRRHGFEIALVAPLLLLWLIPMGSAGVLVVLLTYLVEAIGYGALQRARRGARAGPQPAVQALWVTFATLLILAGLLGLVATGEPAWTLAMAAGVGIILWTGFRVVKASGDDRLAFVARISGSLLRAGVATVGTLVVTAIAVAVGLPGFIAIVVAAGVGFVLLAWILSRALRS